jgi:hypothetical protein
MNSINKHISNLGGIAKLYLIPINQLASLSDPDSDQLCTLVISSFDSTWEIMPIYQSIQFSEKLVSSNSGGYYEKGLAAKIPKDSPQTHSDLQSLVNRKWLVLYLDQNGAWKIVGSPEFPLRFSFSVNPGTGIPDLNHFEISLSGSSPFSSVFIHNPFNPPAENPIE